MANQMQLTTTRFVIRKSLIGKNVVICFVNKHWIKITYNHDDVNNKFKERFDSMNCFQKYKSYTNTNVMPAFCRDMSLVVTNMWLLLWQ